VCIYSRVWETCEQLLTLSVLGGMAHFPLTAVLRVCATYCHQPPCVSSWKPPVTRDSRHQSAEHTAWCTASHASWSEGSMLLKGQLGWNTTAVCSLAGILQETTHHGLLAPIPTAACHRYQRQHTFMSNVPFFRMVTNVLSSLP
jgi:hypothetical protein